MKLREGFLAMSLALLTIWLFSSSPQESQIKVDYSPRSGGLDYEEFKKKELEEYLAHQPEIHVAARLGNISLVNDFLDSGVDVDMKDDHQLTPLFWATIESHPDIVELLLSRGAQIREQKFSLLSIAAFLGQPEIVQSLLTHGSLPSEKFKDRNDFISEYLYYRRGWSQLRMDDNLTALHHASMNGNVNVIRLLLQAGADPNSFDSDSGTPLCLAANCGRFAAVQVLLSAGADPDTAEWRGVTPLHRAAAHGYVDIVKALLAAGAEVNTRIYYTTWTPLHDAAFDGYTEVVKLLLDAGANPLAQDEDGRTPRDCAMQERSRAGPRPKSCDDCAELLKQYGG